MSQFFLDKFCTERPIASQDRRLLPNAYNSSFFGLWEKSTSQFRIQGNSEVSLTGVSGPPPVRRGELDQIVGLQGSQEKTSELRWVGELAQAVCEGGKEDCGTAWLNSAQIHCCACADGMD